MTEAQILHETVIKNGYCIGCGACAIKNNAPFAMKMDKYGNFVAEPTSDLVSNHEKVLDLCPFSGQSKNETELADEIFSNTKNTDDRIGKFEKTYAGFVKEGEFRKKGSSGGVAKWIGSELLKCNEIDYFVQLVPNQSSNASDLLFEYGCFENHEDVLKGSKSSYYPVTLKNIIQTILKKQGRYAITGVPCFIKALRLLAKDDPTLKKRIKYTIGIVCGGMKSANQAKMIGWDLGVHPENLVGIDFRRKYLDRPASQKIYQVWSNKDAEERFKGAGDIFGTDYGSGFFKPKACDYCDDVVGELADISIGDAWLRNFRDDPQGTSLIIIRNKKILQIVEEAFANNRLSLTNITADEAGNSQGGGFRHRREGLSYRLSKQKESNNWYPEKRVEPSAINITKKRKKIYDLRERIAEKSHVSFLNALEANDLDLFKSELKPLQDRYEKINKLALRIRLKQKYKRGKGKIANIFRKII